MADPRLTDAVANLRARAGRGMRIQVGLYDGSRFRALLSGRPAPGEFPASAALGAATVLAPPIAGRVIPSLHNWLVVRRAVYTGPEQ